VRVLKPGHRDWYDENIEDLQIHNGNIQVTFKSVP
jgi:hypothetical protein